MPAAEAKERIERELQEAIDRLRADLVRVEIWANALTGFSRPIPEYQPNEHVTRHLLPRCSEEPDPATRREQFDPSEPARRRGEH
jgi:hypothetical protein